MIAEAVEKWIAQSGTQPDLKCALIDMDGTLYDSMPLHSRAWEQLCREQDLTFEKGEFFLHEGRTGADTIRLIYAANGRVIPRLEEVERLYRRKTELFRQYPLPPVMAGAPAMLQELMSAGIGRVLVTGSGQHSLIDRLSHDFPGAFAADRMVTSHSVTRGKPHPEPFLRAMEIAGVNAAESMVIENAPMGVEAGKASGAFTVAVNTGPIPAQTLKDAGAHLVLPSMEALAAIMPELISALRRSQLNNPR